MSETTATNGAAGAPILELDNVHTYYGAIIVLMMLFRPTGLIAERRHKEEMEHGVADTPMYDVTAEGSDTDRNPSND